MVSFTSLGTGKSTVKMKEMTGGKTSSIATTNYISQIVTPSALSSYLVPATGFFETAVITPSVTLESYCPI
jgi:hypothetical protein